MTTTTLTPMLAREVDPANELFDRLLASRDWSAERKYDGRRAMVVFAASLPTWLGRDGRPFALKSAHRLVAGVMNTTASPSLDGLVLDGELMADGRFVLFDVARMPDSMNVTTPLPWMHRRTMVESLTAPLRAAGVVPATLAWDLAEKRALWDDVVRNGYEGVVFKRIDGTYQPGVRSHAWLKAKCTATADLVVLSRDATSCRLGIQRDGRIVEACGAAVKAAHDVEIRPGVIVEVRYLYADDHLVQPRIERIRTDKGLDGVTDWADVRVVRR